MEGFIKSYFVISVIYLLFWSAPSSAGERYDFYDGIRALGMGGSSIAVVNDETALLYNPAALGKLRNFIFTVADPEIEIGQDTQAVVGTDATAFLNPQTTLTDAQKIPGDRLHESIKIFPSFVVTNFGFGFYDHYFTNAFTNNPATTYTYNYRHDVAAVMGFDFRILDGIIKLGANIRAIDRSESMRTDIPLTTTGMTFETSINNQTVISEGTGVASDAGLILTLPWATLPTLAVVYRDLGTTSYDINQGMNYSSTFRPARTPMTVDAAFAFFPIIGKNTRMSFTVEMQDVMDKVEPPQLEQSVEYMRRLHAGMEFNFSDIFFLRAGMNQGYWTAGAEISVGNTQLQLASYGEEVSDVALKTSTTAYAKQEDRRYVFKFAYRF